MIKTVYGNKSVLLLITISLIQLLRKMTRVLGCDTATNSTQFVYLGVLEIIEIRILLVTIDLLRLVVHVTIQFIVLQRLIESLQNGWLAHVALCCMKSCWLLLVYDGGVGDVASVVTQLTVTSHNSLTGIIAGSDFKLGVRNGIALDQSGDTIRIDARLDHAIVVLIQIIRRRLNVF